MESGIWFDRVAASGGWAALYVAAALTFIFGLASRVPREALLDHEYEYPEGAFVRQDRRLTIAALGALLIAVLWALLPGLSDSLTRLSLYVLELGWRGLLTSPKVLLFGSALLAEAYLCAMLVYWLWPPLLAQAAPEVPDWIVEFLVLLIGIGTIILELVSLPATGPGVLLALLASLLVFLATAWLTWKSFPNTPLRAWFCRVLIGNFWTPFRWLWGSVWTCMKWLFQLTYKVWKAVYEFYEQLVYEIPRWVEKTIFVRQPVRRLIRRLVPAPPAWMPNWLLKAGSAVVDLVDTVIEVVEWVVVALVVLVLELVVILLYILVTVVIWMVWVYAELVCLAWALVVVLLNVWLVFVWALPLVLLGIVLFNLPSPNPLK